jgi:hypothetical protein
MGFLQNIRDFSPQNWDTMCSVYTVPSHDLTLSNMSVTMSLSREVIDHDSQGILKKRPMFFCIRRI